MRGNPLSSLLLENPILVTGTGCVSAAGDSVAGLWDAAMAGRSTAAWREFRIAGKAQRFAVSTAPEANATDPDFRPVRRMDRCVQLAWLETLDPGLRFCRSSLGPQAWLLRQARTNQPTSEQSH